MLELCFAESNPQTGPTDSAGGPVPAPNLEPTVGQEIQSVLKELMPWGISALIHVGLVLLACFLVWSTMSQLAEDELTVPLVRLAPTPNAPLQRRTEQRIQIRNVQRTVLKTKANQTQSILHQAIKMDTALIGTQGSMARKAAPFGTSVTPDREFATEFYGTGGNAKRIVFLIDASGSLIESLAYVVFEMKKSIQQLNEQQSFTIMFFQDNRVVEVPKPGLKTANATTIKNVIEWIDLDNHNIEPGGSTNPLPALRMALRYKPQLLFLLSDNITGHGKYEIHPQKILAEIDQANKSQTKINTIQFITRDPLTKSGLKGTMELIAERSGGQYKFLDAAELNYRYSE